MLMKRLVILCALAVMTASAFAQKSNVKKVKAYIENSTTPIAPDLSNAKPDMIEEYRTLLEPAKTHPESKDMPDTWRYAVRLKIYDMNQMLKKTGGKFDDKNALREFIQNQYDIVEYFETYDRLMHTPNEKGKLPYKEEEIGIQHIFAQQNSQGPRTNLLVGASQFVETDPQFTVKLLELYYETFDNPLYKEMDLRSKDENLPLANFVYATALKSTGGSEEKRVELLQGALQGEYGPMACQELITYYKEKEDHTNMAKYLSYALENYPKQLVFAVNLIQDDLRNKDNDKAIADADKALAAIEADEALQNDDNAAWVYYFKAVALYNKEQYETAYDHFVKAYTLDPSFDNLSSAANCAAMLAQHNATKKDVAKQWYEKAISHYEQCRTDFPDKDDVWGYQLYVCYNNTGNTAKAAQFKKYADKK